jgi:hypothetical protein
MLNERAKKQINKLDTEHLKYEIEFKKILIDRDSHLINMNSFRQERVDYMIEVLEKRSDKDVEINSFLQGCLDNLLTNY